MKLNKQDFSELEFSSLRPYTEILNQKHNFQILNFNHFQPKFYYYFQTLKSQFSLGHPYYFMQILAKYFYHSVDDESLHNFVQPKAWPAEIFPDVGSLLSYDKTFNRFYLLLFIQNFIDFLKES